MAIIVVVSIAVFLILPIWGWGSVAGFLDSPARAGACLVVVLACLASLFSGANFAGATRAGAPAPWILALLTAFTLLMIWLPPFADRRDIAVFDGDITRYTGLALLTVGCFLRIAPMFSLGSRFRAPWMRQQEHRLVTTGFYRHIRNPSYLGAFLGMMGWYLVFRCGLGFLLSLVLIPTAIPLIRKEEAMLQEEFGDEYADYKKRTWRLIPFIN